MKSDNFVVPVEMKVSLPSTKLNETQTILMDALRRLGPNGEYWLCGTENPATGVNYTYAGKSCAIGVMAEASGVPFEIAAINWCDEGPLLLAAQQLGRICPIFLNDHAESFAEVRAMFEKAIQLAA